MLLYLKLTGLLDLPALYRSEYIITRKQDYYLSLRRVTEKGDWKSWILYILDMVEDTATKGRKQIADIERLMTTMCERIQKELLPD